MNWYIYYLENFLDGDALAAAAARCKSVDDLATEIIRSYFKDHVPVKAVPMTYRQWVEANFRQSLCLGQHELTAGQKSWLEVTIQGLEYHNPFLSAFGLTVWERLGECTITIDNQDYILPFMWDF